MEHREAFFGKRYPSECIHSTDFHMMHCVRNLSETKTQLKFQTEIENVSPFTFADILCFQFNFILAVHHSFSWTAIADVQILLQNSSVITRSFSYIFSA